MRGTPRVGGAMLDRAREQSEGGARAACAGAAGRHIEELAYELFVVRGRGAPAHGDDWIAAELALTFGHEPVSIG